MLIQTYSDLLGNQQELLFKLQDTTEATITISKVIIVNLYP